MWIKKNALDPSKGLGKDYDWSHFFLLGLWNLWLQQNRKAFEQQPANPMLVQVVEMQSRELIYCFLETNTGFVRLLKQIQWLKPPVGWHKLNTDGSVAGSCGQSGCGGLLRDSSGQWVVGFAQSICVCSSIAAELWALREGLGLCLENGTSAVEIELDSSTAISLVSNNLVLNGDLSSLVDDCRDLLRRLPRFKLSHCFREANFCADVLAKMGSASVELDAIFISPPPPPPPSVVLQPLVDDVMGLCRPRLCKTGAATSVL